MTKLLIENATLVERHDLDRTLSIFRIRLDEMPAPGDRWFLPGQYVTLGMSVKEGPEIHAVQRAYSIASDPGDRDALEFYIRLASRPQTDRPLTYLVWPLPVGARVHCGTKLTGRFTLEQTVGLDDPRMAIFVAAGTGIAPFVSMVRAAHRSGDVARLARTALLHGASHPHELAYRTELEQIARVSGMKYIPTVSRAAEHPEWTGARGRVESLFGTHHVAQLESLVGLPAGGLSPDRAVMFVCGFRGTIAESTRRLLVRGFVPEDRRIRRLLGIAEGEKPSLFFEQYDLEPVFDPEDAALIEELRRDVIGR